MSPYEPKKARWRENTTLAKQIYRRIIRRGIKQGLKKYRYNGE